MPVIGFPITLEGMINSLMTESRLTSYKIAGYQERVTLVLRFDSSNKMADTDMDGTGYSTQGRFRRKPPNQVRRDKARKEDYKSNVHAERNESCESHLEQKSGVANGDCLQVTTRHESTESEGIRHEPTSSESESDSKVNESDDDDTTATTNFAEKTTMLSSVEERAAHGSQDSSADTDTDSNGTESVLDDTGYTTTNNLYTPLYNMTDSPCYTPGSTLTHHRHSTPPKHTRMSRQHSDNSNSAKESTHNKRWDSDKRELYSEYLQTDESLRLQCRNITKDVIQQVIQSDRNNNMKKRLLDHNTYRPMVIVETDDLLVEYSPSNKKVIKFTVKQSDLHSFHDTTRLRQLEQWDDRTLDIQTRYPDALERIKKALPVLKQFIGRD